jgi:Glycosyltransferases, probably involved in cell wall biogenesis
MVNFLDVSIIVPTYNREHLLPLALDSLLKQDYPKSCYEIIVVDNNSKDGTQLLVYNYIKKNQDYTIRYIKEPRQGLVFARHAGARNAKYEILSFTDDDGILSPFWLKGIAEVFQMNPRISAVAGKITIRWDETPPEWVIPYESVLGKLNYGNRVRIEKGLYINGGNFSIKKEVLYKLGGFNPDQEGEWLIGDGETGLCHKLHKAGCLIGWAPNALMEHFQIVKKNATLKDMRRRFVNNGRCIPYRCFVIEKNGYSGLIYCLIKATIQTLKWVYYLMKMIIKRSSQTEKYRAFLEISYYFCQIPYIFHIFFSRKFKKKILKANWF